MKLRLKTPVATEPVTLIEAKAHLRVDQSTEDTLITSLITRARSRVENFTETALAAQTWVAVADCFPRVIRLERPPLRSVTHIKYRDAANVLTTLDPALYQVDAVSMPGRIAPVFGASWPTTYTAMNAVEVEFVAGYGGTDGHPLPEELKQALLWILAHFYEHRETVTDFQKFDLPQGALDLMWPHRVSEFA